MAPVQLGSLTLQPRRQLLEGGKRLPLGRRALDILSVLAEAKGEIVTKDEIFEAVWPGVIVEENAIQVHVAALRKALGPEARRLVTVRGLGYKLDLPKQRPEPLERPGHNSVAILPFANLTGDPGQGFLCEGLVRELTLLLSRQTDLKVASWLSASYFKQRAVDVRTAARQLGVDTIVEGWVKAGNGKFVVNAELIDASSGYHLWTGTFESQLETFYSLDDALALAIAKALEAQLTNPRTPDINPEALEEYLKGMAKGAHWMPSNLDEVLDHFRRARTLAPNFAKAWAAFAQHGFGKILMGEDDPDLLEEFINCAERALLLDPTLIEGHQALAGMALLRGDWRTVEQHSGLEDICPMRSSFLSTMGQLELALAHCEMTLANNPLCGENLASSAVTAWQLGRLELASDWCLQAIALGFPRDAMPLPLIYSELAVASGDAATAAEEMTTAFAQFGCGKGVEADLRHVYRAIADEHRDRAMALAAIRRLEEREDVRAVISRIPALAGLLTFLNARLGNIDRAFELADMIVAKWNETGLLGTPSLMLFWPECMQAFRDDPRFILLCDQLGMVEYWRRFGTPRSLAGNLQVAELTGKPAVA